jgi:hypothetical protein
MRSTRCRSGLGLSLSRRISLPVCLKKPRPLSLGRRRHQAAVAGHHEHRRQESPRTRQTDQPTQGATQPTTTASRRRRRPRLESRPGRTRPGVPRTRQPLPVTTHQRPTYTDNLTSSFSECTVTSVPLTSRTTVSPRSVPATSRLAPQPPQEAGLKRTGGPGRGPAQSGAVWLGQLVQRPPHRRPGRYRTQALACGGAARRCRPSASPPSAIRTPGGPAPDSGHGPAGRSDATAPSTARRSARPPRPAAAPPLTGRAPPRWSRRS